MQDATPLQALADAYGITSRYHTAAGQQVDVDASVLEHVLNASGVLPEQVADPGLAVEQIQAEAAKRLLPRTVVSRGPARTIHLHGLAYEDVDDAVVSSDSASLAVSVQANQSGTRIVLPAELTNGYYRLTVKAGRREDTATLIVAPERCPGWDYQDRLWGWMVQLYGVLARDSWGHGDLSVLRRFMVRSARDHGADFVLINPLHAANPTHPQQPSPYYPSSRLYRNLLYLAMDELPDTHLLSQRGQTALQRAANAARALNGNPTIDRDLVYRLKLEALEVLFREIGAGPRAQAFKDYKRHQGKPLRDFATYCALAEQHGVPFQAWPHPLRHPSNPEVESARADLHQRVEFHSFVQWLLDGQLATVQQSARDAGMRLGVINDLAVGADAGGADAWAMQDVLAQGISVGAPPDNFNAEGQSWGVPPWLPRALEETGYEAYRALVRAAFAHAGGLRIDHALGLFRLFWVPEGQAATQGTYVRYDAGALMAIIAVEAERAGALVIAEDLGTVEEGVRERLKDWGFLRSAVLWFERTDDGAFRPPATFPDDTFASVSTHDLPTPAGFWSAEPVRARAGLGLLAAEEQPRELERLRADQASLRKLLEDEGLLSSDQTDTSSFVQGVEALAARSSSVLLGVGLADALGETRQPNLPGTTDEYPNWIQPLRRKAESGELQPASLEEVFEDASLRNVVDAVRAERTRRLP